MITQPIYQEKSYQLPIVKSLLDEMEVSKPIFQARQGDVFLKKLASKPATLEPIKPISNKYCLAGSSSVKHVIDVDAVKSFETTDKELESVLVLIHPAKLTHDEHKEITLPEGIWLVVRQREYQYQHQFEAPKPVPVAD